MSGRPDNQRNDWWHIEGELAAVWRWLDERGERPDDPGYFMEKPWKWTPEREQMIREERVAA